MLYRADGGDNCRQWRLAIGASGGMGPKPCISARPIETRNFVEGSTYREWCPNCGCRQNALDGLSSERGIGYPAACES